MNDRSDYLTILLDIKQDIGALNAKMIEAGHSRVRIEESQKEMKRDIQNIKPVVAVVAEMKPQVKELMEFKMRIGAYIVAAGALASGAMYLLWQGLTYFSAEIRASVGRLLH